MKLQPVITDKQENNAEQQEEQTNKQDGAIKQANEPEHDEQERRD